LNVPTSVAQTPAGVSEQSSLVNVLTLAKSGTGTMADRNQKKGRRHSQNRAYYLQPINGVHGFSSSNGPSVKLRESNHGSQYKKIIETNRSEVSPDSAARYEE